MTITEIILGGLILHVLPQGSDIKQLQARPNIIIKSGSYNALIGHNSIGEPIIGLGVDYPLNSSIKAKLGFYYQDEDKFREHQIMNKFGDLVPIIGFEHKYKLNEKLNVNTVFTPILIFSGIGIDF